MSRRCVVAVHAHPDDESSKGAASMAKYAALGVRTVLVTCTDGAAGEFDPAASAAGDDLVEVRAGELDAAVAIIGYAEAYQLGYADSGMTGEVPHAFASVDADRVAERLASIFATERPDVIVTYDPGYAAGHPDHQQSYAATVLAFERYASVHPAKLYGIRTHSPERLAVMHAWLVERGLPSPYDGSVGPSSPFETTTRIDVRGFIGTARDALRAHRSQVEPDAPWFFAVPTDALEAVYPWDDYQLLGGCVPLPIDEQEYETDLFAGLA